MRLHRRIRYVYSYGTLYRHGVLPKSPICACVRSGGLQPAPAPSGKLSVTNQSSPCTSFVAPPRGGHNMSGLPPAPEAPKLSGQAGGMQVAHGATPPDVTFVSISMRANGMGPWLKLDAVTMKLVKSNAKGVSCSWDERANRQGSERRRELFCKAAVC